MFVFALLLLLTPSFLPAADDPGAQYVDAFLLIQEGDAAKAKSDWKTAYTKFSAAQNILFNLKTNSPTWNAHLVQFRLDYCTEQIDAIKPNLASSAPALSATFVAPPKRTSPGAESAELQQLRAELADAMKQIETLKQQLQDARKTAPPLPPSASELDKLRAELAQAHAEADRAKAAQLTTQAELNKKDAELATRLAEMNQKIADLQKQLADRSRKIEDQNQLKADLAKVTAQSDELKKQNEQLTTQLAKARTEAERANQLTAQLDALQKDNHSLRQQLTDANRLLATGSSDLQKLRTELLETRTAAERANQQNAAQIEQLKKENQTLAAQLADSRRTAPSTPTDNTATLQSLHNELAAARAETEKVRADSARQIETLRRERQQLAARLAATETRPAISTDANKGVIYTKPATSILDEQLQRENRELAAQLDSANQQLVKLRARLAADTARARKTNDELAMLHRQNRELALQIATLKRSEPSTTEGNRGIIYQAPGTTSASSTTERSAETERLEQQNRNLTLQLAEIKRQLTHLNRELAAKTEAAVSATKQIETVKEDMTWQMNRLREENQLLRQLLNRYATHHPELKRQAEGTPLTVSPRKP